MLTLYIKYHLVISVENIEVCEARVGHQILFHFSAYRIFTSVNLLFSYLNKLTVDF